MTVTPQPQAAPFNPQPFNPQPFNPQPSRWCRSSGRGA